jgi:hypothetical protein
LAFAVCANNVCLAPLIAIYKLRSITAPLKPEL